MWKNTYAAVNLKEYWAEGSEAWFNPKTRGSFDRFGDTREDLKAYDPELAALIAEVYGNGEWRYTSPKTRLHEPHLQGFAPQKSPTFQWPPDKVALYEAFTRDPESTGDGRWVNLKAYPLRELPRLQASRREGTPTMIVFGNFGSGDVFVYWIAPDGRTHLKDRVRNDMRYYYTWVGALWLLKDKNGKPLAVYRAETKTGRVLILPEVKIDNSPQVKIPEVEIDNSPRVKIPDAKLAAAVRRELRLAANAPITERVMQRLTTLIAPESQITDLTGLASATGLVRFSAWVNQIQDVSPLSKLKSLQQLHLQANQIQNITAFAGLTELRQLHLWGNQIQNIRPLRGLTKLESLWLEDNQIRDVSALAGLTQLKELKLSGNQIVNTAPLEKLLQQNPDMDLDIDVGVGAAPSVVAERPAETALLANFPNPFNPETWIPYELATDTDVRLTIYSSTSVVVRALLLGHQLAGYYTDQERAAYWDGRNAFGEPVASGVYYYQLETDDMSSMRKMVILK